MNYNLKSIYRSVCEQISTIGMVDYHSNYKKKRLIAFNRLNAFGFIFSIIWFIYTTNKSTFSNPLFVLLNLLPALIILSSFVLVYFKKHKLAIYTNTIIIPLVLSFATIEIKEGSVLLYIIIYAFFPFFFHTNFVKIFIHYFYIVCLYGFSLYFIEKNYLIHSFVFNPVLQIAALLFLFAILFIVKVQVMAYEKSLKRNREIIKLKNDELTRLMVLKDQILTTISHDIIVPLASIKSMSSNIMLSNFSKKELEDIFPLVADEVTKTHDLFTNLLDWSKSQLNGKGKIPTDNLINLVVSKALENVQIRANEKDILIRNNVDQNTLASFNANNLQVAVRNLLSNAIKFTPHNGTIELWSVELENSINIYIKDSGIGIEKPTLQKLFTTKANSSFGTNRESGNGFGLKICKQVLEENGGMLYCESSIVGKGSTFVISLPVAINPKVNMKMAVA
jgi:two-component system, sensor histidine kinase and response regulator